MPRIDPSIMVHEIPTYLNVKPIFQWLCPVHPRKVASIKGEVENILKDGFIYPIPLIDWLSNIILVNEKKHDLSLHGLSRS